MRTRSILPPHIGPGADQDPFPSRSCICRAYAEALFDWLRAEDRKWGGGCLLDEDTRHRARYALGMSRERFEHTVDLLADLKCLTLRGDRHGVWVDVLITADETEDAV